MKIKYFGYRVINIICSSRNRYVFRPLSEVEIIHFDDLYELIRHPTHGTFFRIEGDPNYYSDNKGPKKPGIFTLSNAPTNKPIKVKIKTVSNVGEEVVEKSVDDIVNEINEMIEKKEGKKKEKKNKNNKSKGKK